MSNTQIEISKLEVDPNRLRNFSKLPLPDFAISALQKNGFSYTSKEAGTRVFEHDLQLQNGQCKLSSHIQSINTHIDRDGPRIWNGRSDSDVRDPLHSESSKSGGVAN
jgi:hypothetical protein